jgi:hypothetical protein
MAEFSGYFRLVDLATAQERLRVPIPESSRRADDPNPRGGLRGAKGVSAYGDRLVVANSERLFVLDAGWSLVGEFTGPLLGAVHDVLAEEHGIWVTCTAADLLLRLDWRGEPIESWCWRSQPSLVAELGFDSVPAFDPDLDYRDPRSAQRGVHNMVHLNAVARGRDGLLLSFGRVLGPALVRQRRRKAALARLASRLGVSRPLPTKPTPVPAGPIPGSSSAVVLLGEDGSARVLLKRDEIVVPNHNVAELDGLVAYLDSNDNRLVVFDPATGREACSVSIPGSPAFARGLACIGERLFLVGSQAPLALYAVDLDRGAVVGSIELDGVADESVYGVSVVPEEFGPPPLPEALFTTPAVVGEVTR